MAKKSIKSAKPAAAPKRPVASQAAPSVEALFKPFQQAGQAYGFDQAREQLEKFGINLFKGSEDIAQHGKDNVEALVKSSQILAKSAEELTKAVASFTQASMEMTAKASQALLGIKSIQDLAEVQSDLAKNSLEHFISGASKISDMTVKVANEAMEPISQRINIAVEKITKAA